MNKSEHDIERSERFVSLVLRVWIIALPVALGVIVLLLNERAQ